MNFRRVVLKAFKGSRSQDCDTTFSLPLKYLQSLANSSKKVSEPYFGSFTARWRRFIQPDATSCNRNNVTTLMVPATLRQRLFSFGADNVEEMKQYSARVSPSKIETRCEVQGLSSVQSAASSELQILAASFTDI